MLQIVVLLQLTLWVVSIHAFFPWIPDYKCEEDNTCAEGPKSPVVSRAPGVAAPDVVTYKLTQRVPDTNVDPYNRAVREAGRMLRKYGTTRASRTAPEQPDLVRRENKYSVVSPLPPSGTNSAGVYQDGTDFSYFLQVGIGSAGKPFYMLLDTGAGTTWVMGSSCQSAACTMHSSFGPSDSKTYQKTSQGFSIAYGSGSVSGELAKDTIALAGMTFAMSFGVANVTSQDFTHFPFDGILGLSMSSGATDNFLQVVKTTKTLSSNMFGVSLSRNSDGPNTGEVTFGGTDTSKYTGTISYTTVASRAGGDWAIPMDDFNYDGKKAGVNGRLAYVDTGTSYAFGPPEDVAALHKLIPGAKTSDGVTYTVPCDSNLGLAVSFSGVSYTISTKDWMSPPSGNTCTSNIYGHAVVKDAWLLGDLFLKNVYSVFDADQTRIGFAPKPASSSASTGKSGASTSPTPTSNGNLLTPTTTTSLPKGSSSGSSFPGLSGHETSATAGSPVAQTAGAATPTVSSPGEHLEGSKYASIICIVAVIAMVA